MCDILYHALIFNLLKLAFVMQGESLMWEIASSFSLTTINTELVFSARAAGNCSCQKQMQSLRRQPVCKIELCLKSE